MLTLLEIVTLMLCAVVVTQSLAHALELPGKMRLARETYFEVQRIYYPGFTYAGICEPLAIAATLALLIAVAGTSDFGLVLAAFALLVATHALYWMLTAPVNKVWLKDQELTGGARRFFDAGADARTNGDWTALRDRWERSHVYRAVTASAAFVLVATAVAT